MARIAVVVYAGRNGVCLNVHRTLERIRAEFLEIPGLRLTVEQTRRLCGVEPDLCEAVLDALVDAKFLRLMRDNTYMRLTDDPAHAKPK